MDLHVFPILIPPPTSLSTRFFWVFPVHQARALVSCIQPGLVICFTLDNIHVSMLFSRNIPPSPSPTESKSLACNLVSLQVNENSWLFCSLYYSKYSESRIIRLRTSHTLRFSTGDLSGPSHILNESFAIPSFGLIPSKPTDWQIQYVISISQLC